MAKPYAALAMPICLTADTAWLLFAYAIVSQVLAKRMDHRPESHG